MNPNKLPVHFFTIVLNGEPFVRYHLDVFKQLPFAWHWHVIEGLADLKLDTAWSVPLGGRVSEAMHRNGLSHDGTTEYLNRIAAENPDRITIYRKGRGQAFHGKLEMVNAPTPCLDMAAERAGGECLLMQVDVDEFWSARALAGVRQLFLTRPEAMGAFFHCYYFVTPRKYISSMNTWATYPESWMRAWRFRPGMRFSAHEPPTLVDGQGRDLGRASAVSRDETLRRLLTFQHFSYVLESQVLFKELYYGFSGAVRRWHELMAQKGEVRVGDYLPWAGPDALAVDWTASMGRLRFPLREGEDEAAA